MGLVHRPRITPEFFDESVLRMPSRFEHSEISDTSIRKVEKRHLALLLLLRTRFPAPFSGDGHFLDGVSGKWIVQGKALGFDAALARALHRLNAFYAGAILFKTLKVYNGPTTSHTAHILCALRVDSDFDFFWIDVIERCIVLNFRYFRLEVF